MKAGVRSVVGIFVGGASSRMGQPKGLLRAPSGETIVERWCAMCGGLELPCVLVGEIAAYAHLGLPVIADARAGSGPLAGLVALLRTRDESQVIAVACDMPYVTSSLLERLTASPSTAAAVAPRRDGRYEPLFARYERARVLPVAERRLGAGELSLQGLLHAVEATPLDLDDDDWALLRDWDRPSDMGR